MNSEQRHGWYHYSSALLSQVLDNPSHRFWGTPSSLVRMYYASIAHVGVDVVRNVLLHQLASRIGLPDYCKEFNSSQLSSYRQLLLDINSERPYFRGRKKYSKSDFKKAISRELPEALWKDGVLSISRGSYTMEFSFSPDIIRCWRWPGDLLSYDFSLEQILCMSNGDYRDFYYTELDSVVGFIVYAMQEEVGFMDNILHGVLPTRSEIFFPAKVQAKEVGS